MADEKADFGEMLARFEAQQGSRTKTRIEVGKKVSGKVTAVDAKTVFVDVQAPTDALMDRVEFEDDTGVAQIKVGDVVEAMCVRAEDGEIRLSRRLNAAASDASLQEAFEGRVPVEGRVTAEIKGGYEVSVGNTRGFCPYSQMDLSRQEATAYIGQKFLFEIREYRENGRQFVLNRRNLLQAEEKKRLAELQETLKIGDVLTGTVKKIMPFGVFVDIGGIDGMIPLGELAWKRGVKAEDVVSAGMSVTVMVRDLDWERQRISLSLRSTQGDPWADIEARYVTGVTCSGVVTQLMPFGAFVELEPGIEGLIPISKLGGGRRIMTPGEVVKVGEAVEVTIESIDLERRRLSLTLSGQIGKTATGEPARPAAEGATLTGVVEGVREFGVFIRLPDGKTGLLHVSQMELVDGPNRIRMMTNQYPIGKTVEVIIREVDGERISLTLPSTLQKEKDEETADLTQFRNTAPQLGTLGGIVDLDKLKLD